MESSSVKTEPGTAAPGEAQTQKAGAPKRGRPRTDPRMFVKPVVIVALLVFVLLAFPSLFSQYYVDAWTQVAIYSIVTLGLGLLVGRVGMVSLGQGAVLALGAWVAARILFATSLPYPLVLLGAGLITMVLGTLVGLPALRMSGLYLALITLMLAGAITVALTTINFPNGGGGFTGYNGGSVHIPPIRRPSIATTDPAFFRYSVIVAILMFLLVLAHVRGRPGRAWAAIRQSESAALAAGINTTFYKLWAFALASFVTGVAGGLVGRELPLPELADVRHPGLDHAARRGADGRHLQHLGRDHRGVPLQVPAGAAQQLGRVARLADDPVRNRSAPGSDDCPARNRRAVPEGHGAAGPADQSSVPQHATRRRAGRMIQVSGLTVRFGGVTPLDGMDVKFDAGTCGLIGPNGAGKTTFFNVLSGFVRPATGTIEAFGENLLKMTHYRRARWGVRRTFQTEQAIEELSIYDNVAMVHEQSKMSKGSRRDETLAAIGFVGIKSDPYVKVGTLGAGERRLVEVARAVVGSPRVVLLDEPAAGLPDEETEHLSSVIRQIPEHTGALTILVDHDMSLVSGCCETTAVLDFGKLISSGATADVLRDERVIRAYLGTEENV